MLVDTINYNQVRIAGNGVIAEVDETKLAKENIIRDIK